MIGIIFNYLGFATADSYANEAQSNQLANIRSRTEQILQNADCQNEILQIIGQQRDLHLQEIQADQMENMLMLHWLWWMSLVELRES